MRNIEKLISPLVQSHFPEFYKDEGPRFVDFVTQYYAWMESSNQAIDASRQLFSHRDIDTTANTFINHYKQKYLGGIPQTSSSNTQLLVKHSQDFYKSKGTSAGIELVIRGMFDKPSTVYLPGTDLFKTSDGTWVKPVYLELSVSERTKSYVGKEIVGNESGAKAFLESLVRRRIGTKYVEVAYLSNVRGDFRTSEYITTTVDLLLKDAPTVVGSLTSLTVKTGGANFQVGDVFDIVSSNGKQGKARVTDISNETGKVNFIYIDALTSGGWGYSVDHANVIISSRVLTLNSISNANTLISDFERFEGVQQRLISINYSSARGNNALFEPGQVVENFAANGIVNANGTIVTSTKTNSTAGVIVISPNLGNLSTTDTTFNVRDANLVTATFNASIVGDVDYSYTRTFSGTYAGYYTGAFSSAYTNSFTGVYQNAFTGEFVRAWTGAYAGNIARSYAGSYAGAFSQAFTGAYSRAYTGGFTGAYTGAFNSSDGSVFSSTYHLYYINPYTGVSYLGGGPSYVDPYSGTTYLGGFTSSYTASGYTGLYGTTAAFTHSTPPFAGQVFTGGYIGTYTKTYTGAWSGVYADVFTNVYAGSYTGSFSSVFTTLFTGAYTNVFSGNYTAAYTGAYTNEFTGAYTGSFTSSYTQAFTGQYTGYYSGLFTGTFAGTSLITTIQPQHGFSNNDMVRYEVLAGNNVVSPLSTGIAYYVVNAVPTTNTLQLANTPGGGAIALTKGSNEVGHTLTRTYGTAVITAYNDRTAYGNVVGSNTAGDGTGYLGVTDQNSNGFIVTPYANVVGLRSNTTATVANVSTGSGASFEVSLLTDTESVFLSPDFLRSNNTQNVVFSTINLNGNNSGAVLQYGSPQALSTGDSAYGGFGFVKYPGSNMDSLLLDCLRFDATTIGSIAVLTGINPGADYNVDPFVVVHDPYVAGYDKHDYVMTVSSPVGLFLRGEQIQQTYDSPAIQLTVNTFSGTAANGVATTTAVVGEFVYQSNATVNVVASGYVLEAGISGGAGTIKLSNVTGTFKNTTSVATKLKTLSSGATANIQLTQATTFATTARALVKEAANTTYLKLKRINLENTFQIGSSIVGRSSGAVATIVSVDQDLTTIPVGLNADIVANVQVANNVVTNLAVADSGFGYVDQETVTLTKEGSQYAVTALVGLGKQGYGEGFYSTTKGFLDSDKKIRDNDYYQEYSYEVQTKIPYDIYIDVLKKLTHVAGTKAFGRVSSESTLDLNMTAINSISY